MFFKKSVLKNFAKFTGKHLCQSFFFNKVTGLQLWKETPAQVFSCQFCEISKNTFSHRTPLVAASETIIRGFFRTQSNIYDRVFLPKITNGLDIQLSSKHTTGNSPKMFWTFTIILSRQAKYGLIYSILFSHLISNQLLWAIIFPRSWSLYNRPISGQCSMGIDGTAYIFNHNYNFENVLPF